MAASSTTALAPAPRGLRSALAGGRDLRFLLLLAWKNLSRHRRRTVITAGALAVSVAMFIFMDSMLRGIDTESQRNLVWYETGSGRVVSAAQYRDLRKVELEHEIVDYRPLGAWLSERGVANTPRISFTGELFFGEGALPVRTGGYRSDHRPAGVPAARGAAARQRVSHCRSPGSDSGSVDERGPGNRRRRLR